MAASNKHIMSRTNGESLGGPGDYYPTPPTATYSLAKTIRLPSSILEPAAGRGWISAELERLGHTVTSRDLYYYPEPLIKVEIGRDFLDCEESFEGVITNPPYKNRLPEKFVRHSFKISKFMAIFVRAQFLESQERYELFAEFNPSDLIFFSGRVNCNEESCAGNHLGGMTMYCWVVWDRRYYTPHCRAHWVDTKKMFENWKKETLGKEMWS